MEETPSIPQNPEFDEKLCANCQSFPYEGNHPINLCNTCRTSLIKYPIPKWIRVFAVVLIGVIFVSLVRTQLYISAAVSLGKSEKAIENKAYLTAQKELIAVLSKFPDDLAANADFFIAAAYNLNSQAAGLAYEKIAEKKVDDEELLARLNAAISYLSENIAQDTINAKRIDSAAKDREKLIQLAEQFKKTTEPILLTKVVDYLYELEDYKSSQSILQNILKSHPDFYTALMLSAATERQLGNYNEALKYCDRMLAINREDIYAIAQKSRIELKRRGDKQAAVYAAQALALDANNDSALEATAMVNYFNGNKQLALANLTKINAHAALSGDSSISKRLTAIINGTTTYR